MNKKILILVVAAVAVLGVLAGLAFVGSGPMAPLETASPVVSETAVESNVETPAAPAEDSAVEAPAQEPETATGNIIFDGDNITLSGNGWGFETTKNGVTITKGGEYHVSGTANDAQILVDAKKDAEVRLIFEGVDITYSQGAPIHIQKAGLAVIELAEGTENFVTDTENYVFEDGKDEPDAAIFSKDALVFQGSGSLTVTGNYDMAIHVKDYLGFVEEGTYNITAVGDGVKGKKAVNVWGGTLNITAGSDGIQANDKEQAEVVISDADVTITAGKDGINAVSNVAVYSGSLVIDAQSDGIQSDDSLEIRGGTIDITTGGGSANAPEHVEEFGFPGWFNDNNTVTEDTPSAKGLKAGGDLTIFGGDITIDSMDDALHCAGTLSMSDGTVTIATGDDAFHSDDRLTISGGTIDITKSYEGLEGIFIEISGGDISLVASDDGLNAAGGSEADFDFMGPMGGEGTFETMEEASYYIYITGGTLYVDAGGDGLDSNGALYIDGGEVYVSGPTSSADGALDYTTTGQINGGIVVAAGASGMAENFDSTSSQPSFRYVLTSYTTDECPITLTDSEGNVLVDVTMAKTFNSVVISTPDLKVGETYTLTCGLETAEVTLTDTITNVGSTGMGMGGPGGMGGGRGGMGGMDMGGGPGGMMPPG